MRNYLIFIFLFLSSAVFAQSGYKLDFKVKGWKDTTAYLGYYYGESTYVKDTAKVNSNGAFTFDGKNTLPQGIYFLVLDKTRIFEMVISNTQRFSIETASEDFIKNMVVKGDDDNRLFFENMNYNIDRHKEAEPFIKLLQDSTLTDEQKKTAREDFNKINDKVMAYQQSVMDKYPTTLTARIFKMHKAIQIPDPPKRADGSIDSTFQLRYYRQHFFDNFDLADDAFIRMPKPFYQEKVREYLDKLFVPQADTITKAIKSMVAKARKNQETFKYLVWLNMIEYQTPKIMGLDEVYVTIYDTYFGSGEMDFWVDKKLKQNLKEHADKLRLSLVGRIAPNLIMQDQNQQLKSMYDIKKKYTILFFFDPDCGHCREETPKLVELYNKSKLKLDMEIYAVSADTSMQKMKDFVKEMKTPWITVNGPRSYVGSYQNLYDAFTTPTIYILDDKKKIIGKKLGVEKIEDFISNYEKYNKKKENTVKKGT